MWRRVHHEGVLPICHTGHCRDPGHPHIAQHTLSCPFQAPPPTPSQAHALPAPRQVPSFQDYCRPSSLLPPVHLAALLAFNQVPSWPTCPPRRQWPEGVLGGLSPPSPSKALHGGNPSSSDTYPIMAFSSAHGYSSTCPLSLPLSKGTPRGRPKSPCSKAGHTDVHTVDP